MNRYIRTCHTSIVTDSIIIEFVFITMIGISKRAYQTGFSIRGIIVYLLIYKTLKFTIILILNRSANIVLCSYVTQYCKNCSSNITT